MPELTKPTPHTVLAIDAITVEAASDWGGVPAGSVNHPCERSIWYALHWAHAPRPFEGAKARRLQTGRAWETRLLDALRATGVDVRQFDEATGGQFSVTLVDGWLRGKVDGLATGIVEAPKTEHVVECKAMKAADWRGVIKHGVAKHKPDHYAQMQVYMHALGLTRALYLIVNTDTDEIWTERVEADPVMGAQLVAKVARIVGADEAPLANAGWYCDFCPAKAICLEVAWARRNCRTCLHSTTAPGAIVRCGLDDRDLTRAEQAAGCGRHRFRPSLVGGEQSDVVGDGPEAVVVYTMADGSEWRDAGQVTP